ncbi:MAG: ABC transporter ATP-binding protein [Kangiellaceae bacterium]|nr:ABC transporter ATP-binding protein [Kangiellaceae bacterium]|tara:strand:- start:2391 stop:3506 length:1116 start_codon:yes stop_codon:yes gene_type:complete
MNIHKLEIKGFKSIAHIEFGNTSPFLVLAGANGSGKSNLVDALVFLGAVIKRGAVQAVREFGGFSQIHCFKYRKEQRTTMTFNLEIDIDGVHYDYSLKIRSLDFEPEISESLKVDEVSHIDRKSANELQIRLGDSASLQKLPNYTKEMSALMLLSDKPLYRFLTNIRVFRIDPFAAKEPDTSAADATALDPNGKNIATMLSELEKDDEFREQVLEWIELIVPGMEHVKTEKQRLDASTVITFKEEGTKARFPASLISDGTIYALCILTAVLSRARKDGITIIEEPERGIHPKAIAELVQLMRENASTKHPVFITTHSESVVRSLEVEELYFVSKEDGKTQINSAKNSGVDKEKIALDTAWLTNLFDGGLPW